MSSEGWSRRRDRSPLRFMSVSLGRCAAGFRHRFGVVLRGSWRFRVVGGQGLFETWRCASEQEHVETHLEHYRLVGLGRRSRRLGSGCLAPAGFSGGAGDRALGTLLSSPALANVDPHDGRDDSEDHEDYGGAGNQPRVGWQCLGDAPMTITTAMTQPLLSGEGGVPSSSWSSPSLQGGARRVSAARSGRFSHPRVT
ncbi:uncharacterized protein C8Q71DRAFT_235943 [Rhodofomes roseus]|uniref:Uncharacterized protein n=1 Tax=Rhodofomes roseus TaxID=34475 RepID=A0ABQ8KWR7_9APHY|nr:uncharacterized protein C8Q71DRAFT_235943 [Rhodofomes roseus]KAH9843118.1 hypothetical protein C8Q71DRAFT_235943 [Rhodofomes roseus]